MAVLKQLFVIAERKRTEKICAEVKELGAHFVTAVPAHGTAKSDLLEMLGMDSGEKTLITFTSRPKDVPEIMKLLENNFKFGRGGGVAFSVPLTSASGPAAAMILSGGEIL